LDLKKSNALLEKSGEGSCVVKLTNLNQEEFMREESLYRSAFHQAYDEGELIGEVGMFLITSDRD